MLQEGDRGSDCLLLSSAPLGPLPMPLIWALCPPSSSSPPPPLSCAFREAVGIARALANSGFLSWV